LPVSEEGNGLIVTLVKAGRDDVSDQQPTRNLIGLRACVEGSIEVSIGGLPSSSKYPYLEVWYGTGSGLCNSPDRATRVDAAQNCTKLTTDRDGQLINGFSALSTKVQIAPLCELDADQTRGARQGPQKLYFLALRSQDSAEQADFYRAFTVDIDTLAPAAPTNVKGGSGGSENRVTWDRAAPGVTSLVVAADYDATSLLDDEALDIDAGLGSGECASSYLRAGEKISLAATAPSLRFRGADPTSTEMSFEDGDFEGVKQVAVAVSALDLAGNISVLSEVSCITVTGTRGLPGRTQSDAGALSDPGGCSASGKLGSSASSVLAAPVALLFVGAYARRRARRRVR
jgi:hypothetical protein